jgi:hypothetical protein
MTAIENTKSSSFGDVVANAIVRVTIVLFKKFLSFSESAFTHRAFPTVSATAPHALVCIRLFKIELMEEVFPNS